MSLITVSNLTAPPSQCLVHHSSKVTEEVVNINLQLAPRRSYTLFHVCCAWPGIPSINTVWMM